MRPSCVLVQGKNVKNALFVYYHFLVVLHRIIRARYRSILTLVVVLNVAEYAAVGYIAKRIEMRKKRYQNLQKLAEQRRAALASSNAASGDAETASTVAKSHVSQFHIPPPQCESNVQPLTIACPF